MEKKRSWVCSLVLQVCLCVVVYLALNLGQPQNFVYFSRGGITSTRNLDVYFLSVRGSYRDIKQQSHLLKLMENVAKVYKVKFVVNISELGEDDPLTKNASRLFSSMNVPWYTTIASKGRGVGHPLDQNNVKDGKMLIIADVDTESRQDLMLVGSTSGIGNNQLNWLAKTLEATTSNWLVVVGYHPVLVCEENNEKIEAKQVYEPLHHIFMKYGVNAYLSRGGCANHTFQDSVAYIGIADPIKSEPEMASLNGSLAFQKEVEIGFLLHRVNSLEMATYSVTLTGEVVNKILVQQRGREFM
ncbi:uncharacterized protein LOC8282509 [Ricinus communis]|uniref:Uncharacterized protein n=1 Tax=Ricinus communis TaxID=3988 RepID=B9SBY2_RICCO|nr:uncharacterized protein LOC8282509 [Ricinus communis]EEF38840.1 conserved hypothetical protein [Ricinus communis]|eukprot:XP_002523501.1 uncharacterized protein LOC8282509 [Ricinus communis]